METLFYIIGQVLGIVACILSFITFQMKTQKAILVVQIFVALTFSLHYLFLGELTGAGVNFIASIKCICYYFRNKRGSKSPVVPIIFTALIVATSVLTWTGWYSLLLMLGLVVLSIALAFGNANQIRYSTFIKSPLCLAYNIIVGSIGGAVCECVILSSSVIGLIREAIAKKKNSTGEASSNTEAGVKTDTDTDIDAHTDAIHQ